MNQLKLKFFNLSYKIGASKDKLILTYKIISSLFIILGFVSFVGIFLFTNKPSSNIKPKELTSFSVETDPEISYKKGVGGPVLPHHLDELNISWFYSWGTTPYYSSTNFDNYDPKVWEKFVPMFSSWGSDPGEHRFDSHMTNICEKTDYCNKGNYYLIGNEPYQHGMDRPTFDIGGIDKTVVYMQGSIMKNILRHDPTAKFIVLGVRTPDSSGIAMARGYLEAWKNYWKDDFQLANFPDAVKGFHAHIYICNSINNSVENFGPAISEIVKEKFGKEIENQEIWITEMGAPLGNTYPVDKLKGSMNCHVNKYENYSYDKVTRYAWFYYGCNKDYLGLNRECPGSHANSNRVLAKYNNLGSLTELGNEYASMPATINPPPDYLTPSTDPYCDSSCGICGYKDSNGDCQNGFNGAWNGEESFCCQYTCNSSEYGKCLLSHSDNLRNVADRASGSNNLFNGCEPQDHEDCTNGDSDGTYTCPAKSTYCQAPCATPHPAIKQIISSQVDPNNPNNYIIDPNTGVATLEFQLNSPNGECYSHNAHISLYKYNENGELIRILGKDENENWIWEENALESPTDTYSIIENFYQDDIGEYSWGVRTSNNGGLSPTDSRDDFTISPSSSENPTQTISLKRGWNLVSFSSIVSQSPDQVFANIVNQGISPLVWTFINNTWYLYSNLNYNYDYKIDTIEKEVAYWIYLNQDTELEYQIDTSPHTQELKQVNLQKGWNFIGTPKNFNKETNKLNNSSISYIWEFDNSDQNWKVFPSRSNYLPLNQLEENKGYWIYTSNNTEISN